MSYPPRLEPLLALDVLAFPPQALRSLFTGLCILFVSLYTFPSPTYFMRYLRLVLVPPAVYFFWDFAFGPYEMPTIAGHTALATIGLYGIMRVIDTSIIGLWDDEPPQRLQSGKKLPLPRSVSGRLLYAFDLLISARGISVLRDAYWDFAPKALQTPPPYSRNRRAFLRHAIAYLIIHYFVFDAMDALNKTRTWEEPTPYPVTSLSILYQMAFSISVALAPVLSMGYAFTLLSSSAVFFGSPPKQWPHLFNSPFLAKSVADFWCRWHWMFRRVFDRLSIPFFCLLPSNSSPATRRIFRIIFAFAWSALLHLCIIHRLPPPPNFPQPPFWDISTLKFFLLQPLAMLFEAWLVVPLATQVPSPRAQVFITRIWAWGWLLWSGRFWADAWARSGLWRQSELTVAWSVLRGLSSGHWKTF